MVTASLATIEPQVCGVAVSPAATIDLESLPSQPVSEAMPWTSDLSLELEITVMVAKP